MWREASQVMAAPSAGLPSLSFRRKPGFMESRAFSVIPAEAGIHAVAGAWTPAFAGVTDCARLGPGFR